MQSSWCNVERIAGRTGKPGAARRECVARSGFVNRRIAESGYSTDCVLNQYPAQRAGPRICANRYGDRGGASGHKISTGILNLGGDRRSNRRPPSRVCPVVAERKVRSRTCCGIGGGGCGGGQPGTGRWQPGGSTGFVDGKI